MDMAAEIGFVCDRKANQTLSKMAVHMDCLHWVNRDSYLPQGSRGLKVGRCHGGGMRGSAGRLRLKSWRACTLPHHCTSTLGRCTALYCPPLQMVTKYKLGYDPVEVDPEDMVGSSVFFLWACW